MKQLTKLLQKGKMVILHAEEMMNGLVDVEDQVYPKLSE